MELMSSVWVLKMWVWTGSGFGFGLTMVVFWFGGHGGSSLDLWFWYGIEVISETQRMGFGVGMIWFLFSFAAIFALPMGYGFGGFLDFILSSMVAGVMNLGFFFFFLFDCGYELKGCVWLFELVVGLKVFRHGVCWVAGDEGFLACGAWGMLQVILEFLNRYYKKINIL